MTPAETFWLRVQAEAARLISKEPLVAELILRLVPSAGSLSDTVARRLADLLHEPGIAQPRKDQIGVHVIPPSDLTHRHARHPRLTADHPLLVVRPDPTLPSLRHQQPR